MQRNELIKHGNSVFRVLEIRDNSVLLVDCLHKSMPRWIEAVTLEPFSVISENELSDIAGKNIPDYDSLTREHRRYDYLSEIPRSNRRAADASNPFICYNTLVDIASVSGGVLTLCPLGSKPMMPGMPQKKA